MVVGVHLSRPGRLARFSKRRTRSTSRSASPVRFDLKGVDVIHPFWIPSLGGKTQIIPGQTNVTWLEADRPASIGANARNIAANSMPT